MNFLKALQVVLYVILAIMGTFMAVFTIANAAIVNGFEDWMIPMCFIPFLMWYLVSLAIGELKSDN